MVDQWVDRSFSRALPPSLRCSAGSLSIPEEWLYQENEFGLVKLIIHEPKLRRKKVSVTTYSHLDFATLKMLYVKRVHPDLNVDDIDFTIGGMSLPNNDTPETLMLSSGTLIEANIKEAVKELDGETANQDTQLVESDEQSEFDEEYLKGLKWDPKKWRWVLPELISS